MALFSLLLCVCDHNHVGFCCGLVRPPSLLSVTIIMWAFCYSLVQPLSLLSVSVTIIMWAFAMALFSLFYVLDRHLHLVIDWFSFFFCVTIKKFVLDNLRLVVMALFRFISGPIKNFVLNYLKLVVMALFAFSFTGFFNFFNFFPFQTRNFLWDHLKLFAQILLVGSNVKALTREFDILTKKLMDVQKEIEKDEASMKKPTEEVEGWMKRVEALRPSVESIVADYDSRSYLRNIYSNGVRAVKKSKEIRQEAEFIMCVGAHTTAAPPPPVQLMSTTPIEFGRKEFESRLQEALNFLRDDNQGVLGIWGMGGVGKTTLLEHINDTLGKDPSSFGFNKVVLVTASRGCTAEMIQSQIVKKLGLSRGETTDIFNYLHNKSFAMLLDDLWEVLELKEVGIPLPLGTVGDCKRKLILTSRLERVCRNMGARQPALIKVDCLSTEDARLLFRSRVGEDVIRSDLTILKLADSVADLCGGLPIALNAVGRAMAGARDVKVWEYAADELKESKSKFFETHEEIAGTKHNPLHLLRFSYEQLKGAEKKECFLHCALWPEDFEIDKDELIRCWIGHGLLGKVDNVEKTYRKGYSIIDSLQQACLLERVTVANDKFSLRNQHVKLHDVIRDMALWIACDFGVNKNKWIVLAGQDLQETPRDEELWREARKISLMHNNIQSLPSEIRNSPNLTTLMLKSNDLLHGGLRMSMYFNSLKYLDISLCYSLECFPTEICGLTKLEYLNISYTSIRSLPHELKALVDMKYLIVRHVPLSSRVSPELLSNLVNLVELDLFLSGDEDFVSSVFDNLDCLEGCLKGLGISVTTCSNLQKLVQLSGIPISSLYSEGVVGLDSSLELLSHGFLGSRHIRSNLKQLVLLGCEGVEEVVVEGRNELKIERLYLGTAPRLKEIIWKGVEPRDVLPKLRRLELRYCFALKSIEWVMYLPCLELLFLDSCREMEQMFGEEAGATGTTQEEEEDRPTFPSLRVLQLCRIPKLSSICHRPLTFPSLEVLQIYGCRQLRKLPFHSPSSCTQLRQIECDEATWKGIDLEDNMRPILEPLVNI